MMINRKIVAFIFLASFAIRLITAVFYLNFDAHALSMYRKPFLPFDKNSNIWEVIGDRDGYNTLAHNILTQGNIGQASWKNPSIPPPLYSIFLAIFYFIFGFNIFGFFIFQIIFASINAVLLFYLSRQIFNDRTAVIASLFYIFNPHFIISSIQLYSENLYFFFVLSVFLFSQKLLLKPSKIYAANLGIFMALAALCRSVFFAFLPFMFIWLIAAFYHQRDKMIILVSTIFLSFSLVYGIWVIRNYKVFNRILFSVDSRAAWEANRPSDINEVVEYRKKYKDEGSALINWVKRNPKRYLILCVERLKTLFFKPCVDAVSLRHKIVSTFLFFVIYPLGYIGIFKALKEKKEIALLGLLYIGSKSIFLILTSIDLDGELRYRLPVELFITIFAAYGLNFLWERHNLLIRLKRQWRTI